MMVFSFKSILKKYEPIDTSNNDIIKFWGKLISFKREDIGNILDEVKNIPDLLSTKLSPKKETLIGKRVRDTAASNSDNTSKKQKLKKLPNFTFNNWRKKEWGRD